MLSKYAQWLQKEFDRHGGQAQIRPLSDEEKPTAASMRQLDREISAQISANSRMRQNSIKKSR